VKRNQSEDSLNSGHRNGRYERASERVGMRECDRRSALSINKVESMGEYVADYASCITRTEQTI